MQRKLRVFLDTSAVLSGLNSPTGAAGVILAACFSRTITPVISAQVVEEADRNIAEKFPRLISRWQSFLLIPPEFTRNPTVSEIRKAHKLIATSDSPILAAAIKAKPDALVTWDYDFLSPKVQSATLFPILLPEQFLSQFLKSSN